MYPKGTSNQLVRLRRLNRSEVWNILIDRSVFKIPAVRYRSLLIIFTYYLSLTVSPSLGKSEHAPFLQAHGSLLISAALVLHKMSSTVHNPQHVWVTSCIWVRFRKEMLSRCVRVLRNIAQTKRGFDRNGRNTMAASRHSYHRTILDTITSSVGI